MRRAACWAAAGLMAAVYGFGESPAEAGRGRSRVKSSQQGGATDPGSVRQQGGQRVGVGRVIRKIPSIPGVPGIPGLHVPGIPGVPGIGSIPGMIGRLR